MVRRRKIRNQPSPRFFQYRVLLAESEANKVGRAAGTEKCRYRNGTNARLARQAHAKIPVGLVGKIGDRSGDEISAFAPQHAETRRLQCASDDVALFLQLARVAKCVLHFRCQTMGHAQLQRGRGGEGVELMRLGDHLDQSGGTRDPADLPSRQRKHLAGRANAHATLAHAGKRDQRHMGAAVEHEMLIDLIAYGV